MDIVYTVGWMLNIMINYQIKYFYHLKNKCRIKRKSLNSEHFAKLYLKKNSGKTFEGIKSWKSNMLSHVKFLNIYQQNVVE